MMVSDEFRCHLQLVNVVDGFFGGRAIGQKLSWGSVDNESVSVLVLDHVHQWDAPQFVVGRHPRNMASLVTVMMVLLEMKRR